MKNDSGAATSSFQRKKVHVAVAMLIASAAIPMIAAADDAADPDPATTDGLAEVSVTGTRIVRDGYQAPTPLTVVGGEDIQQSATPSVADYVNTIPSFSGSRMPNATNSSMSGGSSGMNSVNLRNLGLNRTLVLLDSKRVVGSTSDNVVDLNLFPQNLIQRVEIVTGGASAAYGSDAVAGVVNFILDKKFTGFKADVSGGMTDYGDNGTWDGNLAFGTGFADDRGHFLIAGEASHVAGIAVNDRPWNLQGYQYVTNPAYGTTAGKTRTVPERILLNQVSVDNAIAGGIITASPAVIVGGTTVTPANALRGTAFGIGGTPYQFVYGNVVNDPDMSGGQWQASTIRGTDLANGLTSRESTQNAFSRVSFNVTDSLEVYAQGLWAHNQNHNWCCGREDNATITIKSDNAFIPTDVKTRMTTLGLTQFTLGTMNADLPRQGASNDRETQQYSVGANGAFELMSNNWKWDAYYQRGVTNAFQQATGVLIKSRHLKAIDSVKNASGQIVCRVNADADPNNNDPLCVPYNVFGIGVNGAAVVDYITGNGARDFRDEKYTQDVGAFSINGEPFSLWAGPVSIAFGGERRQDKVSGNNDPISRTDDWYVGNYKVFTASNHVTEGFLETVVPLAEEKAWAKSFDLNAAVRYTDYSTSGNVTTWKGGLTYSPVSDVIFRATRSRDIRAPNLQELYNAGAGGFPGVINPFRGGATELIPSSTVGNPNLVPEESDYKGIGIVLQPRWTPGFSASVDFWNLNIADAIGTISAQQTIDQCFAGNQATCAAITFNPDNSISGIKLTPFNLVSQIARGLDIESTYRVPLSDLVSAWGGDLTFRALGTHYIKNYSSNGINKPTDTAGQNTGSGPPDWRWNASVNYTNALVTLGFTARGVSDGVYLNSNVVCTAGSCPISTSDNRTVDTNHIAGAIYFDASLAYKFVMGESAASELYVNIRNLTNKDPAIVAPGPGGFAYEAPPANATLYDTLGRTYRLGFRVRL